MGAIIPAGAASGQTIYGQIVSASDASVWNGVAMEAYNQGDWASYTVAMPEQPGSSRYILTVPGGVPDGHYFVMPFIQLGGSPAAGDTPIDLLQFDFRAGNVVSVGSALNIGYINGSAPAAVNLSVSASTFVIGAAAAGTLTNMTMTTNLVATVANLYAGRVLYFTSGVNAGLAVLITAYAVTGGKLTFIAYGNNPAPAAPSAADTFVIF